MKRRYADYLANGQEPPPDYSKPPREEPHSSRAWFERAEDSSQGSWTMTVEHGMQFATNHQGEFRDLVNEAKRAGVTEYYVWSAEDADSSSTRTRT